MFVSTPNNQVIAIDAKSGNVLWRYRRPRPTGSNVPHDTSRGVALLGDRVYFAAGEAVLVALDAKTGREVWTTDVADNKSGYYISLAPLIADGKVMVGASGGEFGIRGFVAAYDPETGKEQWRTYTIPAPGEPGSETWPKGDQWKNGGGSVWVTGNYDPDTNLAYWGVGNGGPWMGDQRPGDNLYTSSTIALDVATGKIKGHYQYHPNDSWDWDEVSPPILVDFQRNGRTIKGLIDVARDGYLWFLDRSVVGRDGRLKFVEGKPFVNQNVFKRLDPETGRPEVDPAHKPGTGKHADFCPGLHGGKNWPPIAFSPKTRMIYVPANNNLCGTSTGTMATYVPGRAFTGVQMGPRRLPQAPTTSAKSRLGMSTPASACGPTTTRNPRTGEACSPPPADWSSAAAPTTARFTPSTRPAESSCGSPRRAREFSLRRPLSCSMASSMSPCSRAGAATPAECRTSSTGCSRASIRRFRKAAACGCTRSSNRSVQERHYWNCWAWAAASSRVRKIVPHAMSSTWPSLNTRVLVMTSSKIRAT